MKPVSLTTMNTLLADPFMKQCCLCKSTPVQWHHNKIFQGRQVDNPKTILPVCHRCHAKANENETREKLDLIMLNRMTDDEIKKYSKVDNLIARRDYLKQKYGDI